MIDWRYFTLGMALGGISFSIFDAVSNKNPLISLVFALIGLILHLIIDMKEELYGKR